METFNLTSIGDNKTDVQVPITGLEEKELRRVFDRLCDYQARTKCKDSLHQMEMGIKIIKNQSQGRDTEASLEIQKNIDNLKKELSELENKNQRLISSKDVYEMLKELKQKTNIKDVEEMIWEVDEDLDGYLNWSEFRLMYNRNLMDKTGLEPSKMFYLVQFLIYDKNENNRVSVDETMNMLYARYGKVRMEEKLRELFGGNMQETGREGGDISFSEFTSTVEKVQLQTFWKTTKGRIISSTSAGRKSMELSQTL